MTDFHTKFIADLVSGMENSCYEYDVERMFGRGENRLIVDVLCESAKNEDYDYEYNL